MRKANSRENAIEKGNELAIAIFGKKVSDTLAEQLYNHSLHNRDCQHYLNALRKYLKNSGLEFKESVMYQTWAGAVFADFVVDRKHLAVCVHKGKPENERTKRSVLYIDRELRQRNIRGVHLYGYDFDGKAFEKKLNPLLGLTEEKAQS